MKNHHWFYLFGRREIKRSVQVEIIDYRCLLFIPKTPHLPHLNFTCIWRARRFLFFDYCYFARHTDLCFIPLLCCLSSNWYNMVHIQRHVHIKTIPLLLLFGSCFRYFHIKNSLRYFHVFILYFLFLVFLSSSALALIVIKRVYWDCMKNFWYLVKCPLLEEEKNFNRISKKFLLNFTHNSIRFTV